MVGDVYECLDIHRMLMSHHFDGTLLRFFESRFWRVVDLLLTSSPAFIRHYFMPRGFTAPIKVIENKLLVLEDGHLRVNPAG
jgi:succinoglycan biosynthesis protein ExoL